MTEKAKAEPLIVEILSQTLCQEVGEQKRLFSMSRMSWIKHNDDGATARPRKLIEGKKYYARMGPEWDPVRPNGAVAVVRVLEYIG